jgi:3-oxoacyl-[acyl-carrier protein] reductase/meso-butanediol dehydrogenase/(S,S)-butanediol dehydrogenase/diacetyl reductase
MGRLDGAVVLVTGAARKRGLGRAIALRAAAEGADVAVCGLKRDPDSRPDHEKAEGWVGVESLAEEIRAMGRRSLAADADVTSREQLEALFGRITSELGLLYGLVNNAGVASEAGAAPILDMDDAVWRHTVDVNLTGVYLASKLGGKIMLDGGKGGSIVNISSLAGRFGIPNYGAYCASKFGVIGLTQQMSAELARSGIRVNCVCPGSTDTDMMDGTMRRQAARGGLAFETVKASYAPGIPMGRQGRPEEQASATVFLLGPDASYITGQTLNVDGGVRMD